MTLLHQKSLSGRIEPMRAVARRPLTAAFALFAILLSTSAYGADYSAPSWPDIPLRGSEPVAVGVPNYPRWEGFYFGAQAGQSFTTSDFGNGTQSLVRYILANSELEDIVSNWTALPKVTTSNTTYGGFLGYNFQWGEVITGVELNYNRTGIYAAARDTAGPLIVAGTTQTNGGTVQYDVTVVSTASVNIHDIMSARARFGWTYDRFLPYGFIGAAVGIADVTRSADVFGTKTVTTNGTPVTGQLDLPRSPQMEAKSVITYGFSTGLGLEVGLLPNVFLRAEWEYVQFPNIDDFRVSVNSVHAGVGLKF